MVLLDKLIKYVRKNHLNKINVDILVLRINCKGELGNSAPCLDCSNILKYNKYVNIRKLYYSLDINTIKEISILDYNTKHISRKNK